VIRSVEGINSWKWAWSWSGRASRRIRLERYLQGAGILGPDVCMKKK
jgi:hypothetical protein